MTQSFIAWADGSEDCQDGSVLGYWGLIFWISVSLYIFVGLYVLCEEYFVPTLTVLGDKLGLSEDVCGATLMAAGSSSPEFLLAVISTFLFSEENSGPASNCAATVFNMCVVIGLSIVLSGFESLELRSFPFMRDSFFYGISALMLYFFYEVISPGMMEIWESGLLMIIWISYVLVAYFDLKVRNFIVNLLRACRVINNDNSDVEETIMHTYLLLPQISHIYLNVHKSKYNLTYGKSKVMKTMSKLNIIDEKAPLLKGTSLQQLMQEQQDDGCGSDDEWDWDEMEQNWVNRTRNNRINKTNNINSNNNSGIGSDSKFVSIDGLIGTDVSGQNNKFNTIEINLYDDTDGNNSNNDDLYDEITSDASFDSNDNYDTNGNGNGNDSDNSVDSNDSIHSDSSFSRSGDGNIDINGKDYGPMIASFAKYGSKGVSKVERTITQTSNGSNGSNRSNGGSGGDVEKHGRKQVHIRGNGPRNNAATQENTSNKVVCYCDWSMSGVFHIITKPFDAIFATTIPSLTAIDEGDVLGVGYDPTNCRLMSSFFICIIWMAFLSWIVVDMSSKIGNCLGISPNVMGLTLLAVGSSIPDSVSAILVAKQGRIGMAVSNALGCNVFGICVCVGFTSLLKSALLHGTPIEVTTSLEYQSFIIALFVLLGLFALMMFVSKLVLTRKHGYILLAAYVSFVIAFSVVLQGDDE